MGALLKSFLCLLVLALSQETTEAFKHRTLSGLSSTNVSVAIPAVTPAASAAAAVSANFPANLTGNLTGIMLPSAAELLLIEQYVLNRTRPSVTSFVDGTKTTIDCVNITSQLSLSNPALRNHTVTTVLPKDPMPANTTLNVSSTLKSTPDPAVNATRQSVITPAANATSVNGTGLNISRGCPMNTVPVPRLTLADIARFGSLQAFLNVSANKGPPPRNATGLPRNVTSSAPDSLAVGHEYAVAETGPGTFYGIQTQLSVWQPFVQPSPTSLGTFSLSQVWVEGGDGNNLQTIEAGWQVSPDMYHDNAAHLFIFSTRADYTDPGACYAQLGNCQTESFVQISKSVYPTMALQATVPNGQIGLQSEYALLVFLRPEDGNWWVKLNDEWVGYYPGSLYTALAKSADYLQVGGEIVDGARLPGAPPGQPHTKTQMGSGLFGTDATSSLDVTTTAYHSNMFYVDSNQDLQTLDGNFYADGSDPAYGENFACYSGQLGPILYYGSNDNFGPIIFWFGGPGFSDQCAT